VNDAFILGVARAAGSEGYDNSQDGDDFREFGHLL
jgi:hypothetical protein